MSNYIRLIETGKAHIYFWHGNKMHTLCGKPVNPKAKAGIISYDLPRDPIAKEVCRGCRKL